MWSGVHKTPGNRCTYAIFIYNDLILVSVGHKIFFLAIKGGFKKIEKH